MYKLNLGCGSKILDGYVNLDAFDTYGPQVIHNLETFPWPFEDDSVDEILMSHVLEHLGRDPDVFLKIVQEIYRICANGAKVRIVVPHPRHDDFINDPTHVRIVTPQLLTLFDRSLCDHWVEGGFSNSPFAHYLNVDLRMERVEVELEEPYKSRLDAAEMTQDDVNVALSKYLNVARQFDMTLVVNKRVVQF